ncbi:MAG TPA: hypothetical protein PLO43_01515 [Chlamydiales bacterium]|nr:hypothetical protein [Chlamydiales bacterium]
MSKPKRPKSEWEKEFKCTETHPIRQIFEMQHAFWKEAGHLKVDFEEDITCIGDFFRGTMEKATHKGLPHEFFQGEGPRFAHAYYRLFFSNNELFPDQKDHPSDFEAWASYEALTNPDFDPNANASVLELVNLRTALELYQHKGRSINSIIQEAEEQGRYEHLEEALNVMVKQYYETAKKKPSGS